MGKRVVIARLRPKKDDDIRDALNLLPSYIDESDVVRAALRMLLLGQKWNLSPLELPNQQTSTRVEDVVTKIEADDIDDEDELESNLDNFIND